MSESSEPLLSVRGLRMHFPVRRGVVWRREVGRVRAVDGVDLDVRTGETVGLVGESGCGKSTCGRAILQLYGRRAGEQRGEVRYRGRDLNRLSERAMRPLRRELQIIFQDPYASLNPRMTVAAILAEPLRVHGLARGARLRERVAELMETVGLSPEMRLRYPHEFSGGQRQRIGIARALAVDPRFVVCDEPISSLDVSIQAQVMNLMADLQARFGLAYLFIAHDLAAVRHICDRVAVMYLGRLVEVGDAERVYARPQHPYTRALLSAAPEPNPTRERQRRRTILSGDVPTPLDPPAGCRFHTRCPFAERVCREEEPALQEHHPGHWSACHLVARGELDEPPLES